MTSAREEVLARIRTALAADRARSRGRTEVPPFTRTYRRAGAATDLDGVDRLTERFMDRLLDYRAHVVTVTEADLPTRLAEVLRRRGIARIAVPDGFPARWLETFPGDRLVGDVSVDQLGTADGTVSLCATAMAETGTIVLDAGAGQGTRALSLVPDYLLVVVRAEQIVPGVPEGVAALDPGRPLTWISGPSATSDIELKRVEGVHGPRTLDVVIVDARPAAPPDPAEGSG